MKILFKKKDIFENKTIVYILFSIVLASELACSIVAIAQPYNKMHWMVFIIHLVLLLVVIGSFLFFWFKKIGWMRSFISIVIFIECIYTIAYAFMSYPKTPDAKFTSFVLYVIYGCFLFSIFINVLILNAHLNEERDWSALNALIIQTIIFSIISSTFFLYALIQLCWKGYTAALLIDVLSFASSCLVLWYAVHIEKISLPLVKTKYYTDKK